LKGYNVYKGGVFLKEVATTSTSDTGLTASTAYSYTVKAVDNANNESAQSNIAMVNTPGCPDTTAPSVPTGLTATAASCSQINLSWNASTDTDGSGLKGYNVYRNGSASPLNSQPVTTTSYTDSNLQASTPYSYTVAAVDNANNQSDKSTTAGVTTPSCTSGGGGLVWDTIVGGAGSSDSVTPNARVRWTSAAAP
jgi:chitodextrinase